ncbi:hypothetical protein U9M48_040705 [Paspalum notatum var. saurae]|uniref:Uncharacterized protein n=1 Tax=Paspalum notatum var. saurae TaxID=547442 RepID=A0AAQ3UP09_PASNO
MASPYPCSSSTRNAGSRRPHLPWRGPSLLQPPPISKAAGHHRRPAACQLPLQRVAPSSPAPSLASASSTVARPCTPAARRSDSTPCVLSDRSKRVALAFLLPKSQNLIKMTPFLLAAPPWLTVLLQPKLQWRLPTRSTQQQTPNSLGVILCSVSLAVWTMLETQGTRRMVCDLEDKGDYAKT